MNKRKRLNFKDIKNLIFANMLICIISFILLIRTNSNLFLSIEWISVIIGIIIIMLDIEK